MAQRRLAGHRSRLLGLLLAGALLVSACGPREEIVYVDRERGGSETGHGAYTPFGQSSDPWVHADGSHQVAEDTQIGPAISSSPAPYTPFGASSDAWVHADGGAHAVSSIALANERQREASASGSEPERGSPGRKPESTAVPRGEPSSVASGHAAEATPAAARAAATPTAVPRLNLGAGLGATAARTLPIREALVAEKDDEQSTVAGRVESIAGPILKVKTTTGLEQVKLGTGARVERDSLASPADLKPGQFVGVIHAPGGPATSIRLYSTGPSMPRAGIVPMVGSRVGQVTTFGSIVSLQFGGLVLNTGGETAAVTLPSNVEILKPAALASADLAVGTQLIATGPLADDGTLVASAVRVTAEARPAR